MLRNVELQSSSVNFVNIQSMNDSFNTLIAFGALHFWWISEWRDAVSLLLPCGHFSSVLRFRETVHTCKCVSFVVLVKNFNFSLKTWWAFQLLQYKNFFNTILYLCRYIWYLVSTRKKPPYKSLPKKLCQLCIVVCSVYIHIRSPNGPGELERELILFWPPPSILLAIMR